MMTPLHTKPSSLSIIHQRQDLRSLAAFRILLGLYILYDVASRLQHGRLSLAFYTSSSSSSSTTSNNNYVSFLHPNDTPHKSPIHLIWFYRGSELFQLSLFLLTAMLAVLYSLGYSHNQHQHQHQQLHQQKELKSNHSFVLINVLLWLNVTAMQCRNMHVHDGSDTFTRHLLLWSCFLPMNQRWSFDTFFLHRRRRNHTQQDGNVIAKKSSLQQKQQKHYSYQHRQQLVEDNSSLVSSNNLAVWGLRLQIVFMYLGTVASRTIDMYGFSLYNLSKSEWLPPSLTAVYYSLNASFSVRDCWLGDVIRNNFLLTQIMTMSAMFMEGLVPVLCLIFGMMGSKKRVACILPLLLFKLHFGLLLLMKLPNWQIVGMIASVIWIQSSTWDMIQRQLSIVLPNMITPPAIELSNDTIRKKDIEVDQYKSVDVNVKRTKGSRVRCFLTNFFFVYMIYNFAGERRWIRKHDGGDIGEFLRFSQYWVMFATPPKSSEQIIFTGKMLLSNMGDSSVDSNDEFVQVDVWQWIKDGSLEAIDLESRRKEIWHNMTEVYPSPRIERMFDQLSSRKNYEVLKYFLEKMCVNGPFEELTFIIQRLKVMPPSSPQRFGKRIQDSVLEEVCL